MDRPVMAAIVSIESTELSDFEKYYLEKYNPLGITFFAKNIKDKIQLKALTDSVKECVGRDDIILAVDQEGGRVRRLTEPEFHGVEAQISLGKIRDRFGEDTAREIISAHAALIAADMDATGLNMNYAPVLDTAYENTTPVLFSRCFGNDEKQTAAYGKIMIDTYIKYGVSPCMKHMPGHGRAAVDPHLSLPVLNYSLNELEKDFYPFEQNHTCPAGMTAHIVIPEIDDKHPATQSARVIDRIIRGKMNFDGLLISDSLTMQALKGSVAERVKATLEAGCDVVCYCMGTEAGLTEVAENCTFLTDKSLLRFEKIKNIYHNRTKVKDVSRIAGRYREIVGTIEKYNDNYDATEVLRKMTSTGVK